MKKVLITGSNGQLGKALIKFAPKNIELILTSRDLLDFNNNNQLKVYIRNLKPDWIINCAAYTSVDIAENNLSLANQINGFALKVISSEIKKFGGKLIHISTDFVFNGEQNRPYSTEEKGNPINVYGNSKLIGEIEIENQLSNMNQAAIIRTSWLMGHVGKNFISTIIRLNNEKIEIPVVSDQIGSPTSTFTLSKACWRLIEIGKLEPINKEKLLKLHWSDAGVASWYDIAVAIGEISYELGLIKNKAIIHPIKSLNFKTLAKRPRFSVLDVSSSINYLGLKSIHWRTALLNVLKEIKKLS